MRALNILIEIILTVLLIPVCLVFTVLASPVILAFYILILIEHKNEQRRMDSKSGRVD